MQQSGANIGKIFRYNSVSQAEAQARKIKKTTEMIREWLKRLKKLKKITTKYFNMTHTKAFFLKTAPCDFLIFKSKMTMMNFNVKSAPNEHLTDF